MDEMTDVGEIDAAYTQLDGVYGFQPSPQVTIDRLLAENVRATTCRLQRRVARGRPDTLDGAN